MSLNARTELGGQNTLFSVVPCDDPNRTLSSLGTLGQLSGSLFVIKAAVNLLSFVNDQIYSYHIK